MMPEHTMGARHKASGTSALRHLLKVIEDGSLNRWSTSNTPLTAPQKTFVRFAYEGSFDAALLMFEAFLPDWRWVKTTDGAIVLSCGGKLVSSQYSNSLARTMLIATLRAKLCPQSVCDHDMDSSSGLLPCPFCGGKAEHMCRDNGPEHSGWQHEVDHWVSCLSDDCFADMGLYDTEQEAVRRWNTRKPLYAKQ